MGVISGKILYSAFIRIALAGSRTNLDSNLLLPDTRDSHVICSRRRFCRGRDAGNGIDLFVSIARF